MQVKHGELSRNLNRFKVCKDLRFTQRTAYIASTTMTHAVFVIAESNLKKQVDEKSPLVGLTRIKKNLHFVNHGLIVIIITAAIQ
jgi:hypothetical protein